MDEVRSIPPGNDALARAVEAAAQVAAWQARLVEATREAMTAPLAEPWRPYLAWQLGLTTSEAADLVELADRLDELPLTEDLLTSGERSLRSVLAIARRCTPDNEAIVIDATQELSGAQLERVLREYAKVTSPSQRVDPDGADESDPDGGCDDPLPSSASWTWRDGRFCLRGDFDPADGAALQSWLDTERSRVVADGAVDEASPVPAWDRTAAEALLALGERAASTRATSEGFVPETIAVNLVVHAREEEHGLKIDRAFIPGIAPVPHWWATMMAEQGTLTYTVMLNGEPILATEPARFATPAQRQAMLARDGGCTYPDCGATRRLIAHHIRYYDNAGPTELRNMVLLCRRHHRIVHRNSLRIQPAHSSGRNNRYRWQFTYSDGSPLRSPGSCGPPGRLAVRERRRGSGEALTRYARDVVISHLVTAA